MHSILWLFNITEARALEVIQMHQSYFKFDGGVVWGVPRKHPVDDVYAVKVHGDCQGGLTVDEQAGLQESLPSDWVVEFVLP